MVMTMSSIDIIECTLRDASYTLDYQFTVKDTTAIGAPLEDAGFRFIEIGHGLCLNASQVKKEATATDEAYLRCAKVISL